MKTITSLKNVTLLAPSNEAWIEANLDELMKYGHLIIIYIPLLKLIVMFSPGTRPKSATFWICTWSRIAWIRKRLSERMPMRWVGKFIHNCHFILLAPWMTFFRSPRFRPTTINDSFTLTWWPAMTITRPLLWKVVASMPQSFNLIWWPPTDTFISSIGSWAVLSPPCCKNWKLIQCWSKRLENFAKTPLVNTLFFLP